LKQALQHIYQIFWQPKLIKKFLKVWVVAVALFLLTDFIFPLDTHVPYSTIMQSSDGTIIYAWLARDHQWRMKAELNEISPELKAAVIFKEDRHFYRHGGVNPLAVCRAIANNIFRFRRTSGASTIDMQVARMLEPKSRNFLNKFIEMFRALQLELHYSKDEILQLYLNLAPYGSNIQGVKAASLLYFKKMPDHLSLAEATALCVTPNRPNTLLMGHHNELIIKNRNQWLKRFREAKIFPDATIDDALREPLDASRHDAPHAMPQLAWRMKKNHPGMTEIKTTIDKTIQAKAEEIVDNYMNELRLRNINNAAILVIDNRTHSAKAYIGSPDFKDRYHYGEVDGVLALRSPGSALKPLLYGLCFDKGFITPKTMIADIPINIQGYTPENYDRTYRGNVTIEYALSHSLNIPAVKLLDKLSTSKFISSLSDAGFENIWKRRTDLGLSIVLGGCEVRLEDLTALYASFANGGVYSPINYTGNPIIPNAPKQDSAKKGVRLLSPGADFMVSRILLELHRPDLPGGYEQAANVPHIAWKTGTSYGRKDAWSVGYNNRYTIGVWVGNFSGAGVPDLSGATTATPLLFDLFNAIDHEDFTEWLTQPMDVDFRLVCTQTGKIPDEFCQDQLEDYYIPGVSAGEKCDHMKEVWVSADEKFSYCTACLPPSGYRTKMLPHIPTDLAAYYDVSGIAYTRIPPHNPACTRLFNDAPPIITSLTNGKTYMVFKHDEQKLQLSCTAANDVHRVFWYIDDKFFAAADAREKLFFAPNPKGSNTKISCTDDKGRNANIQIKVKFI